MVRKLGPDRGFTALALAAVLVAVPARAMEAAKFSVDCPGLSPELRSSLEARALADLAPYERTEVRWQVTCRAGQATVDSFSGSDLVRQSQVPLSGEPKSWVEQILSFLHEVVPCADVRRPIVAERSLAPQGSVASASVSPAPPSRPSVSLAPASPAPNTDRRSDREAVKAETASSSEPRDRATNSDGGVRTTDSMLDPSLALDSELWTPDGLMLVGPTARFGLWVNPFVRIVPSLGAEWSSARRSDIGVRLVGGGVDVNVGKRIWGSFGARLVWIALDASSQFGPSSKNLFEPELAAQLGTTFALANADLSVALGLRAYAASHEVHVNGASVLLVPLLAPLASVEYRFSARN